MVEGKAEDMYEGASESLALDGVSGVAGVCERDGLRLPLFADVGEELGEGGKECSTSRGRERDVNEG